MTGHPKQRIVLIAALALATLAALGSQLMSGRSPGSRIVTVRWQ